MGILMRNEINYSGNGSSSPSTTTSLSNLTDVQITSLANGQGLFYDEELQKWVNGEVSSDTSVNMVDGRFYYVVESASTGGDDASIKVSKYLSKTNALVEENTYLYTVAKNTPIIIDNIIRLSYADIEEQTWCLMSLSNLVNISTGDTYGVGAYINTWKWSVEYSVNLKEQSVSISTSGTLKPWLYDSENEVVIGVYDGKPLYRKIIKGIDLYTYDNSLVIENIDTLVGNIYGRATYINAMDGSTAYSPIPAVVGGSSSDRDYQLSFNIGYDNGIINISKGNALNSNNYSSITADIICEYTKTTDTEGSGEGLMPYGVGGGSLLNYSTEEQVIGTWIDGRPIYQKTITDYNILNTENRTVLIDEKLNFLITVPTGVGKFTNALDGSTSNVVIPHIASMVEYQISFNATVDGYVLLEKGSEISQKNYSSAIATITFQYTKTTDTTT